MLFVKSREFTKTYIEQAPAYSAATWAAWWAFRLLPADELDEFETAVAGLFEQYKKGKRTWATYNLEKRKLLRDTLKRGLK